MRADPLRSQRPRASQGALENILISEECELTRFAHSGLEPRSISHTPQHRHTNTVRRYFQHAHFIPIVGVGKRGEYYLFHGDLPRQHSFSQNEMEVWRRREKLGESFDKSSLASSNIALSSFPGIDRSIDGCRGHRWKPYILYCTVVTVWVNN